MIIRKRNKEDAADNFLFHYAVFLFHNLLNLLIFVNFDFYKNIIFKKIIKIQKL